MSVYKIPPNKVKYMNNKNQQTSVEKHCGFVAIIGAPNAGKSTLLNNMLGTKIAIVTPKVQTTRYLMRAIQTIDNTQIIYIDTPGIFKSNKIYEQTMVANAWSGAKDSDIILMLIDASKKLPPLLEHILSQLKSLNKPKALVLNKIDKIEKTKLLEIASQINNKLAFEQTFFISALKGDGISELQQWIVNSLPKDEWLYPPEQISDLPMRFLAAEITREKLFLRLQQELPYGLTVETEQWQERKDGSVKIMQQIIVERESHKKIILGKNGNLMKAIGISARKELENMLGCKVHLFLFVKVIPNWKQKKEFLPIH